MNKIEVYIILLNYNGWQDTIECVQSLECIQDVQYRIIVVDNKSTDDSVVQLKTYLPKSTILIESEENNGFSAGNNIGIKYAIEHGGKYVLLLNNDTLAEEDFLSPMINFIEKNKECGCMSCRIYYNNERNRIWFDGGDFNYFIGRAVHYRFNEYNSVFKGIHEAGFISGCCMLIPCDVIKKIGLMDERYFLYVEDTEYSLRIRKFGYKLFWNADYKIYHKVSASTKKLSNIAQYYEIRNRILLKKTYLNSFFKVTSMIYDIPFYTYKIFSRKYAIKILYSAIVHSYKNIFGKIDS